MPADVDKAGHGIEADDYEMGALEDWAPSALTLDGQKQYLSAKHADIGRPFEYEVEVRQGRKKVKEKRTATGADLRSPDIHDSNLAIEVYVRTTDDGVLVQKRDDDAGYVLRIENGRPVFELIQSGQVAASRTGSSRIADGQWHHLFVEADRGDRQGLRCYVDGTASDGSFSGAVADYSLANKGDLLIGGGPGLDHLACTLDFVRIARGTLADSDTTIEELHAWQFDGPAQRDFTGIKPTGSKRDAGAIEAAR
jgi:hypothetical protein